MYYIIENKDGTKTVVLTFLRSELLNDLDQYGYVEGDVQRADADHLKHGKHQTQDITQDGNIDLVTRHLNLAFASCREALYPYSKKPVADGRETDDTLTATSEYVIELNVPEDFSETTQDFLEELIHNLLIYYVLYWWLSMTKPEGADKWLALAERVETKINGALARGCGKVYRRMSPFDSGTVRR